MALGIALGCQQANSQSEPPDSQSVAPAFSQSIGVSPFSLAGAFTVNYERLLARHHGLALEVSYDAVGESSGSWHVQSMYRYHFNPAIDGLFVGAFARYGKIRSRMEIEEESGTNTYRLKATTGVVGLDVFGYRAQWDNGLALAFRAGYGYQFLSDFQWTPAPEDRMVKNLVEAFAGADLELSLGYSF